VAENTLKKTIAITGANGYLGRTIARFLESKGYIVYGLVRTLKNPKDRNFVLGSPIGQEVLKNIDVLIHCAWDMTSADQQVLEKANVQGSIKLLRAAEEAGVSQTIFISSISAFEECKSQYGKMKLAIEKETLQRDGVVIRPGLIYGNIASVGGMLGALSRLMEKFPLLPCFSPDPPLYMCNEEDLCQYVSNLIEKKVKGTTTTAACPAATSFKELLTKIATLKECRTKFIPIPWQSMYYPLRGFDFLGISLGFKSDSLLSLMNPVPNPDFSQQVNVAVNFRPFESSNDEEIILTANG